MKILVYGSDSFDDYATFMRGLIVAIEDNMYSNDNTIEVLTAGPHKINNFTAEFVNRTEGFFKQKGVKTKFKRVRKNEIIDDFEGYKLDHIISFNKKTDQRFFDVLMDKAENSNINSSYYKY
jgi:hypothetical protein